jgi:uncharacterized membrane protein
MVGAELYDWLKFLHILMAITWVGGAITLQILAIRIVGGNDPVRLAAFAGEAEFVGTRIFTPASLLLLAFGIWMVIDEPAWTFAQFWVLAGLGVFAFSFVSGAFYISRQSARLKKMYADEGSSAPEAPAIIRRIFVISRIELVLMVLVVADMVLKPGL